jgi:hypothetical protein
MFDFIRRSMIARLLALSAVVMVTGGLEKGCVFGASSGDPIEEVDDGSGDGDTFVTTLILRDSSGTETYSFEPGELIIFELSVRNRTAVAQTVTLATTNSRDFYVYDDGEETALWNAMHDQSFPAVNTPLEFAANETKSMTFTWDQELPDGTFLPAGRYDARGLVAAVGVSTSPEESHELRSVIRGFEVN